MTTSETAALTEQQEAEIKYCNCSKLPLTMWELYVLEGDLQGMSAEHWEKLHFEFLEISGNRDISHKIHMESQRAELICQITAIETTLGIIEMLYHSKGRYVIACANAIENGEEAEAEELKGILSEIDEEIKNITAPLLETIKKRFKSRKLEFSEDSWREDIKRCFTLNKSLHMRLLLLKPEPEEANRPQKKKEAGNFIDIFLIEYQQTFGGSIVEKDKISTGMFAVMARKHMEHFEHIAQQNAMRKRNLREG